MKTLVIKLSSYNIGQIKEDDAHKEVKRLNAQENTNKWRIDKSDFIFVPDETNDHVQNPCQLSEGYVWVVKD